MVLNELKDTNIQIAVLQKGLILKITSSKYYFCNVHNTTND